MSDFDDEIDKDNTINHPMKDKRSINHPLEDVFNIEHGTTMVPAEDKPTELVVHTSYDEKDNEIEGQLQNIHDKAMEAFRGQQDILDVVDGKYAARNAEVAVNFLNAALAAIKEKAMLKQHKDKLKKEVTTPPNHKTINNNIIIDRNELLKQMFGRGESDDNPPIDGEKE